MKKSDPDSIETQYYEALFEAEKLRKENAELRRQLAEEKETLRVVLDELGASHKVEDESIDLRRQLAEVQEDEVIIISERDAAEKEAAELRAKYNELWRENEANALANIDLRRRLDAVPVVAILECIGPDDYDFTAPTLTVLEFANWLEAERAARI